MMKHYPTHAGLRALSDAGVTNLHYGFSVHGNPRHHKFYFRIFWRESPVEGPAFMATSPLGIKAARDLIASLAERCEPYAAYVHSLYRAGIPIWNLNHPKFSGIDFAPSFDDDPERTL